MNTIEKWNGRKYFVRHLRTVRCVAYAYINVNYRNKIDAKSHACIMMGYSDESKSYRLSNPVKQQIILSKNVIFDENILGNKLFNSSSG